MAQLLGLLLLSFFISAVLFVPFIDFLYKMHLNRSQEEKRVDFQNKATPIIAKLFANKGKKPIGGGGFGDCCHDRPFSLVIWPFANRNQTT